MADSDNHVSLLETSPYTYAAIGCFFVSSCSSDLLVIRTALMIAFVLLTLAAWSGHSPDGSFSSDTMPFVDGSIDLSLILYTILYAWNLVAWVSLLDDIRPRRKLLSPNDQALYYFFQRRCGLTRVEFDEIRSYGEYLEIGSNKEVPNTDSTLYLILEGLVECETIERHNPRTVAAMFPKRSGQFFDLKLFNIFSLPVGFDSLRFRATTSTKTKLFGWNVKALAAMRDSKSPALKPFWDFMILRSLARDSVRHHLQATDSSDNVWPLPENPEWYDGLPSCDFQKPAGRSSCVRPSWFHILPPRGIRSRSPSMILEQQRQQQCIEIVAGAKQDCLDRMDGDERSYQSALFMSTFGCFNKESSEKDSLSSPANIEEPTNPSIDGSRSRRPSLMEYSTDRSTMGKHEKRVPQETTPQASNDFRSSLHRLRQEQETESIHVPEQRVEDRYGAFPSHGSLIIPPGDSHDFETEHQSGTPQAEEAKSEIQLEPAPKFESVWKEGAM